MMTQTFSNSPLASTAAARGVLPVNSAHRVLPVSSAHGDLPVNSARVDLEARWAAGGGARFSSRSEDPQVDAAEERSLVGAMLGLCVGWFAAGPVGGLAGLWLGAVIAAR